MKSPTVLVNGLSVCSADGVEEPLPGHPGPEVGDTRVSLARVAAELGVSKATVCRALRGQTGVSAELRARVVAAAESLGYRPDPVLSSLSARRWQRGGTVPRFSIAIVRLMSPLLAEQGRHRPDARERVQGVWERCRELEVGCEEFLLPDYPREAALSRIVQARGFHGVVFSYEGPTAPWHFDFDHFACVGMGLASDGHPLHRVCPDPIAGLQKALQAVTDRGYRRIGFLRFVHSNPGLDLREHAAIEYLRHRAQRAWGRQPLIFEYPIDGDYSNLVAGNRARFHRWRQRERPEVLIDTNRLGFWWLRDAGHPVPERYGYVSVSTNSRGCHPAEQALAGIIPDYPLMGRWAVNLLLNFIRFGQRGLPVVPVRVTVPGVWREGSTLRTATGIGPDAGVGELGGVRSA
jgi:LacI family transcriptional regulator